MRVLNRVKYVGLAEREILLVLCMYYFQTSSVLGFPINGDHADSSCRYLVWHLTVPSMAQLHGYRCPPRGGRGWCRRACERIPLRGRRRCAADEPLNIMNA
jgi:hypothetical protein